MVQQSSCKGLLVFEHAGGRGYRHTCYGQTTSVSHEQEVDLRSHHQSRQLAMEYKDALMHSMHCLGASVYQTGPDASGETLPPFCLGVEFLRYSQAMQQYQHAADSAEEMLPSAHQQQAHQHAAGTPIHQHSSGIGSQASTPRHTAQHAAQQAHQQQPQQRTPPGGSSSSSNDLQDDAQQLGLFERLQRRHAELSERVEGKDPLWFAKAFANRASLNWASMKRVAGEIAAQAKADLGMAKPDETE